MSHPVAHPLPSVPAAPAPAGLQHPTHYADPIGHWYEVLQRGSAHWHQLRELTDSGYGPAHWQQITGRWSPLSATDLAYWQDPAADLPGWDADEERP